MPRNAECFQLGVLCSEQYIKLWVYPNAGYIIIKLRTWKLRGNSIGLTKQGRILYTSYLGLNAKFHIYVQAVTYIEQKLHFVPSCAPTASRVAACV